MTTAYNPEAIVIRPKKIPNTIMLNKILLTPPSSRFPLILLLCLYTLDIMRSYGNVIGF